MQLWCALLAASKYVIAVLQNEEYDAALDATTRALLLYDKSSTRVRAPHTSTTHSAAARGCLLATIRVPLRSTASCTIVLTTSARLYPQIMLDYSNVSVIVYNGR